MRSLCYTVGNACYFGDRFLGRLIGVKRCNIVLRRDNCKIFEELKKMYCPGCETRMSVDCIQNCLIEFSLVVQ